MQKTNVLVDRREVGRVYREGGRQGRKEVEAVGGRMGGRGDQYA